MKTLFEDTEFLDALAGLDNAPAKVLPQPQTPPPSNAVPLEKALPGFYTGKALSYGNYDADFLAFAQKELPNAFSFFVQDIDSYVIRSRTGKMSMLELKRNNYPCKEHQARTIAIIDYLICRGIKSAKGIAKIKENGKKRRFGVEWYGYNVLKLSNDSFENSTFEWNGKQVSRQKLVRLLSMDEKL